ncbi:hypothetical protein HYFRA_00011589 [Hymenoscyphus fraxineus]|uniref:RING-type domain-containing protein n=1 Tax=Hymenoscyphus fraxineus TaxID=746836 RepID=A0A9N9PWX2_9HELO|nr:hypothetical protein HYFRA_00011589 [Hymenoscyphus fraxineus]
MHETKTRQRCTEDITTNGRCRFHSNIEVNLDYTCTSCLANPVNYHFSTPPELPNQLPSMPPYSEGFISTLMRRYERVIDGYLDHPIGGDPHSFNRVSFLDSEFLSGACSYLEYSIRYLMLAWVPNTQHPIPDFYLSVFNKDGSSFWKDFPEEIRSRFNLLHFLQEASTVLKVNELLIETLRVDLTLWDSILGNTVMTTDDSPLKPIPLTDLADHEKECFICLENIGLIRINENTGESSPAEAPVRFRCPGKHAFGRSCIETWIKDKEPVTCPSCRQQPAPDLSINEIPHINEPVTPWWIAALRGEPVHVRINELLGEGREHIRPQVSDIGVTQGGSG